MYSLGYRSPHSVFDNLATLPMESIKSSLRWTNAMEESQVVWRNWRYRL
jgi:hypothetical protein